MGGFDLAPDDPSPGRKSKSLPGIVALVAFALLGTTAVVWDYLAGPDAEGARTALDDASGSATQDAQGSGAHGGEAGATPGDGQAPDATTPAGPPIGPEAPVTSTSSSSRAPSPSTSTTSTTSATPTTSTSTSTSAFPLPQPTLPPLPPLPPLP